MSNQTHSALLWRPLPRRGFLPTSLCPPPLLLLLLCPLSLALSAHRPRFQYWHSYNATPLRTPQACPGPLLPCLSANRAHGFVHRPESEYTTLAIRTPIRYRSSVLLRQCRRVRPRERGRRLCMKIVIWLAQAASCDRCLLPLHVSLSAYFGRQTRIALTVRTHSFSLVPCVPSVALFC